MHRNNGAVVSFTGDGLIILFPKSPLDALFFLVEIMRKKRTDQTFQSGFDFGMGVHHGSVILGAVGQPTQMNITVLSDIVNTSARIESVTRDTLSMIVVSAAFIDACGIEQRSSTQVRLAGAAANIRKLLENVGIRCVGNRLLKGKSSPTALYDIAFVENASEFQQSVDFINWHEDLRYGSDMLSDRPFALVLNQSHRALSATMVAKESAAGM